MKFWAVARSVQDPHASDPRRIWARAVSEAGTVILGENGFSAAWLYVVRACCLTQSRKKNTVVRGLQKMCIYICVCVYVYIYKII